MATPSDQTTLRTKMVRRCQAPEATCTQQVRSARSRKEQPIREWDQSTSRLGMIIRDPASTAVMRLESSQLKVLTAKSVRQSALISGRKMQRRTCLDQETTFHQQAHLVRLKVLPTWDQSTNQRKMKIRALVSTTVSLKR